MAKTATETTTKTATKTANSRTRTKADKPAAADKPKREPTAYQIFCKEHMKKWNEAHPGRAKEAMSEIALMWKDAPENPNRGQEPKARKPKAPKEPKEPKAKAPAKPRAKKSAKKVEEEEEDNSEPAGDEASGDASD
ncbi:hypothetical protein B0H34DRAFT_862861 [Crassisporium funariophilum]|nr:hypothetical protein B0H34DRAFT_862861 [Crassisporium funariophilum]